MKKLCTLLSVLLLLLFTYKSLAQIKLDETLLLSKEYEHKRLDSNLSQLRAERSLGTVSNRQSPEAGETSIFRLENDKILVEICVKNEENAVNNELQKMGVEVISTTNNMLTAWVDIQLVEELADIEKVQFIRPVYAPVTHVGVTTTQGDVAQRSNLLRTNRSITGNGRKIGVLSDSYNNKAGAATGISTGDLPGVGNPSGYTTPVQVLKDMTANGSDEGRAMLELVHDVAPAANLAFYTAFNGQTDFANGIKALANAGCQVIVDDVSYLAEPFFQDGIIAQAVNQVASQGVLYFSSAGNMGRKSYEASFTPSASTVNIAGRDETPHEFAPGDTRQTVTVPTGRQIMLSFQWATPFFSVSGGSGASSDLNIYLVNSATNTIIAQSISSNVGGDPVEILSYTNTGSTSAFEILITKRAGSNPSKIKYIIYSSGITINEHDTKSGTIVGHANTAGAVAVGAAAFYNTNAFNSGTTVVNSYSSVGGVSILFNTSGAAISPITFQKPEIVGPDGGNTTFFGSDTSYDTDSYPNFFGTSAAAPHVAAAAALLMQIGATTLVQVKEAFTKTTLDMDDPSTGGFDTGFDYGTGYGDVNSNAAGNYAVAIFPVELVYFKASQNEREILLQWQTATETQNEGFIIERSFDGKHFEEIDFINGKGTTSRTQNYQYRIIAQQSGRHYYRLTQRDLDGKITRLPVVSVFIEKSLHKFFASTNRFGEFAFHLQPDMASEVSIKIYDLNGRQMAHVEEFVEANMFKSIELPKANLSSGFYVYRAVFKNGEQRKQFSGKISL